MPGLVGVLVTLGMVVVAPLGLSLLDTPGLMRLRRWWPLLGVVAGAALLLPRGPLAVALVTPYAVACAAVTACGLRRALWLRSWSTRELTALTAAGSLSVAALSLVAERAGVTLLGFSLTVHGLTVAHFHFAGFAAALLAGLTAVAVPGRPAQLGALAVPPGHGDRRGRSLHRALDRAGRRRRPDRGAHRHVLGGRAAGARSPGRPHGPGAAADRLAGDPCHDGAGVWFALGRASGLPHLSIADTAATHGVVNAVGVGLCGLLAWSRAGALRL